MEDADGRDYPITKNRKKPNLREALVLDGQQITKSAYEQLSYRFDSCNLHKILIKQCKMKDLSFDDKIKVWMDYVVTQSCLNNDKALLNVGENKHDFINTIHFPILSAYWGLNHNIKILNFEDFVELRLEEWVSKFEKRIFKTATECQIIKR